MPEFTTKELDKIPFGSADIYIMEWTGTLPDVNAIEQDIHMLGRTKNGMEVAYTIEKTTVESDDGKAKRIKSTKEKVEIKWGVITWNARMVNFLCSTAEMTETDTKRTVEIGGIENDNGKYYVLHAVHRDKEVGDIRLTLVGQPTSGWNTVFNPTDASIVNSTFEAIPYNSKGKLIKYVEEKLESGTTPTVAEPFEGGPVYSPENEQNDKTPVETFDYPLDD